MTRDEAERLLENLASACDCGHPTCEADFQEARAAVLAAMTATGWRDTETDPPPKDQPVLLYCPDRGNPTNRARIELGPYWTSRGSLHAWATHWQPLPAAPEAPK